MMTPRGRTAGLGYLTWCAVALLAIGLFTYLSRARTAITSDVELDYGEGTVYWQTANLTNLKQGVHPLGVYPYILFNYTPLYHVETRIMGLLFPDLLAAGRLVSVLSMLGICSMAGLIVWQASRGWARWPCALTAALLLLHLPNTDWSLLMRVDIAGILFVYIGLLFFVGAVKAPWKAYAAFGFFVLAIYSKQTLIAAPTACLACLLVDSPRRALRVMLAFAAIGFAILLLLNGLTDWEWARHFFEYNVSPAAPRHGLWMAWDLCRRSVTIVPLGMAGMALTARMLILAKKRTGSTTVGAIRAGLRGESLLRTEIVFAVYLSVSALASVSILKVGANQNYLLEPLFACCVLTGLVLYNSLSFKKQGAVGWMPARLAVVAAVLFLATTTTGLAVDPTGPVEFIKARQSAHDALLAQIRQIPGDVYSEEMTLLLQADKQVPAEPASVTFLAKLHLWDEHPLVERFRTQFFSALAVNTSLDDEEHFSPAVRAEIKSRYELREVIGPYLLYRPKTSPVSTNGQ